jgi:hypothetical protein
MKHGSRFFFASLFAGFLFALPGCNQTTQPAGPSTVLSIDLEYDFRDDLVKVELDDVTLLQSVIATNFSIDLAWSTGPRKVSIGTHTVRVLVNTIMAHDQYQFNLVDTTTLVVRYNRQEKQLQSAQYKGMILRC